MLYHCSPLTVNNIWILKGDKIMRKWILMLSAFLLICLFGTAFGGNDRTYGIQTEGMKMEVSGLSAREWAEAVAKASRDGQEHPLDAETVRAADPEAKFFEKNGTVYSIQGKCICSGVENELDAYFCANQMLSLMGGSDETVLNLWSVLTAGDRTVYVFQQVHDGLTVVASTIKLVTNAEHNVTAVFSSLSGGDPVNSGNAEITAAEAEAAVKAYLNENQIDEDILSVYTNKVIIPIESDFDAEEVVPDQIVWAVYTRNPRFGSSKVVDLPYLAHYVQMDGTYLYNNTVTKPRDMASLSGYNSIYTFEFMEHAEWSGEVHYADGRTRQVTVPVMRDTRTNAYYLGDVERRIAVGDFAALAYGDEIVQILVNSRNEWEDLDIIAYDNYIRAWDFFAGMGWTGPDGLGTPTLLLRKLCFEDGTSMENACYIGKDRGWQCFAYSDTGHMEQCLDVMAHEFMHCVTSTIMNTNLYQDDWGAINEAMSDIMGNICELSYNDTTDMTWLIGENSGKVFRSMSDPRKYGQPEYVWDVFYGPHTDKPNDVNDRGGVHSNSSILNLIAAKLCRDGGMTLVEAKDFFMLTACGMTPKTDYPQMVSLLRWALEESGNKKYMDKLNEYIAYGKLEETEVPENFPDGQYLAVLELPETAAFADPYWACLTFQIDIKEIKSRIGAVFNLLYLLANSDEKEANIEELYDLLGRLHLDGLAVTIQDSDADGEKKVNSLADELLDALNGIVTQHMTWRQAGTNRMPMVLNDRLTIHMLMNFDTKTLDARGIAVLIGDQWMDALELVENEDAEIDKYLTDEAIDHMMNTVYGVFFGNSEPSDMTQIRMIPANGLERIKLHKIEIAPKDEPQETKTDEEQSETAA